MQIDSFTIIVLLVLLATSIAVLRLPGFRSRDPQAVVLKTSRTPWQVVMADVRQFLKIVVLALIAGLAICAYLSHLI